MFFDSHTKSKYVLCNMPFINEHLHNNRGISVVVFGRILLIKVEEAQQYDFFIACLSFFQGSFFFVM